MYLRSAKEDMLSCLLKCLVTVGGRRISPFGILDSVAAGILKLSLLAGDLVLMGDF